MYINFIGNVTRDVELRTVTGHKVCDVSVAVNSGYGEKKTTEFIKVTLWDKHAESVYAYLKKGVKVYIDADSVRVDSYIDKNGAAAGSIVVPNVRNLQILSAKTETEAEPSKKPAKAEYKREVKEPEEESFENAPW